MARLGFLNQTSSTRRDKAPRASAPSPSSASPPCAHSRLLAIRCPTLPLQAATLSVFGTHVPLCSHAAFPLAHDPTPLNDTGQHARWQHHRHRQPGLALPDDSRVPPQCHSAAVVADVLGF
eukprot:scaffold58990_cov53-Phaeocystis_antarctica.AAC.1